VVAEGKLFVAQMDAHTMHALRADNGDRLWQYTAGARIDSPPTIYKGLAIFGSADGHVYCLRASDGALVWRLRAAPHERRVVAFDQLESAWPVPGSVLIDNNRAGSQPGGRRISTAASAFLRSIRSPAKASRRRPFAAWTATPAR